MQQQQQINFDFPARVFDEVFQDSPFGLEKEPYSILDQSFHKISFKEENEDMEFLRPSSQRTTGDLSQIIDFCTPEKKEEIGFGYEPDNKFDEYLLDFSPTTQAAEDSTPTVSLLPEVVDEIQSSQVS